jgi:4-aminobutyrate aminotransferase/(S)-3-amino-2-methylpropionate transaminase
MLAFEIIDPEENKPDKDTAKELISLCYEKGLVILTCGKFGNIIRLLMPLVINDEDLERGFKIIEENLKIIEKKK